MNVFDKKRQTENDTLNKQMVMAIVFPKFPDLDEGMNHVDLRFGFYMKNDPYSQSSEV